MAQLPDWIKDYWWAFCALVGVLGWVIKLAINLNAMKQQHKRMQRDIRKIFSAVFVVLDGLKKMGCNGTVTIEYDAMRKHVLDERGYDEVTNRK